MVAVSHSHFLLSTLSLLHLPLLYAPNPYCLHMEDSKQVVRLVMFKFAFIINYSQGDFDYLQFLH